METYKLGLLGLLAFIGGVCCQEISLDISTEDARAIGDDVTFHCRINDFPAGAAVIWWKRQGDEEVQIGQNTEVQVEIERYDLETKQANSALLFYLNIRGIQPEDNGDFGCALSTEPEKKVFRNLVVSDPVVSVRFYQISPDTNEITHEFMNGEEFYFHEDQEYFFQCVASGSNPIPDMKISIGYEETVTSLNEQFNRTDKLLSDPTSGDVAFRKTNYEGALTSYNSIVITWKANSQQLRCSAVVPNMDAPLAVIVNPIMKISPVLECPDQLVLPIWTPEVTFECNVYADPEIQDIRWYWGTDHRATSLKPGEESGAFKFELLPGTKPDMKIARMSIRRIFIQMYRDYHLAAINEKGLTRQTVRLVKGK